MFEQKFVQDWYTSLNSRCTTYGDIDIFIVSERPYVSDEWVMDCFGYSRTPILNFYDKHVYNHSNTIFQFIFCYTVKALTSHSTTPKNHNEVVKLKLWRISISTYARLQLKSNHNGLMLLRNIRELVILHVQKYFKRMKTLHQECWSRCWCSRTHNISGRRSPTFEILEGWCRCPKVRNWLATLHGTV